MPGRGRSQISKIELAWGAIDMENPQNYKPWITPREFYQGHGRRHMVPDIVYPNRIIYLMSDLEKKVYYRLRQREEVLELFEQYPLNTTITSEICHKEGIRHPMITNPRELAVMTTDFLAVMNGEEGLVYRAYAVKMTKDLKKERVLEKLRVEQLYWESFGIPWCIVTENNIA